MTKKTRLTVAFLAALALPICAFAQDDAPKQILITDVDVFDGASDTLKTNQTVLVEGRLIKAVGEGVTAGGGAEVIDGGGRVLTPGFIDAHTHIALIAPFDQLEKRAEHGAG